ncbi:GFA family protein [Roseovarius ramblicola]|uniref:GFA family protein n=1 Tax=Roseovarius ramblicola TaxID=2022336 RepID=A0ABV5I4E9_9RHOB
MHQGSCLCGAVAFVISGPMRSITACHCHQCRKQSGHLWAATSVAEDDLTFEHDEGLTWYRASATAERGFCDICGSTLFWKPEGEARIAITAASIDEPTGLTLERHVFVADKGDYYVINDGLPQFPGSRGGSNA